LEEQRKPSKTLKVTVASIDEFKLGEWWMYTLTDVKSQTIVDYALCESRDEEVVRSLIAKQDPKLIISDGCKSIRAGVGSMSSKRS
jgi:hypothetical protein